MAEEAEEAAQMNHMGTLYRITKQLCNKKKHQSYGITCQ